MIENVRFRKTWNNTDCDHWATSEQKLLSFALYIWSFMACACVHPSSVVEIVSAAGRQMHRVLATATCKRVLETILALHVVVTSPPYSVDAAIRLSVRPSVRLSRLRFSLSFARWRHTRSAVSYAFERGQHGWLCPHLNAVSRGGTYRFAARYLLVLRRQTPTSWVSSVGLVTVCQHVLLSDVVETGSKVVVSRSHKECLISASWPAVLISV